MPNTVDQPRNYGRADANLLPISIVTPSFNQAPFLEHALRSVLSQEYPKLEYIVIDGGSSDGSKEIIERHASQIAYWVSESDGGHAQALNKGFGRSTSEIMAWLNSDDMYLPWTLRTVSEIFATHPEIEWITGVNASWDERGHLTAARENLKNQYDFLIGRYAWIQQESTFWRRSLWEAAGGYIDESYRFMVDGELWSRFFRYAEPCHVGCVLGGFRAYGKNRSALHMGECHAEMRHAIKIMRQGCSPNTRRIASVLSIANRSVRFFGRLPVRSVARRAFANWCEEASYCRLSSRGPRWEVERTPFAL